MGSLLDFIKNSNLCIDFILLKFIVIRKKYVEKQASS